MTVFFIVAALLVVAALLFIVPPLLRGDKSASEGGTRRDLNISIYQDQSRELERDLQSDVITREQYERGREELERRMLEDVEASTEGSAPPVRAGRTTVLVAVAVAALVPLLATGLYMHFGAPAALDPEQRAAGAAGMAGHGSEGELRAQIASMVTRLEERLAANPEDGEGWAMLGRSYLWMERIDLAAGALEKAVTFNDRDPQLLVDYADALAMIGGQSLEGRPLDLIERALSIDPNNQKALWLAGTAAYERTDYAAALDYWQRLRNLVPAGSDAALAMDNNIAEVRNLLGDAAPAPAAQPPRAQAGTDAAGAARIEGRVVLAEALRERIEPGSTLFVYARAAAGPRMPLAVLRVPVGEFPFEFTLDDSLAMDASMSLSRFEEVVVLARISRSGGAMTQSGDLQGASAVVRSVGAGPVTVVIDEVAP
ncbi:MAG: c-type cytochrome biogenesis protein CcmI [Gammaproteobacteria bacterium]|jgi:cytochrome c-type biogenesis protein CcmH|nr:c-type cytochrome biogenesis protein CcmI [Gammaproteobacteria bacterium]